MFDNFISLGKNCTVALSASKYGLRGWSRVFDWLVTNKLSTVLHFIESDFMDLKKDNLEISEQNSAWFCDKKYDVVFKHDIEYIIENDYNGMREKYKKRIRIFRRELRKKNCFLRYVYSCEELNYILNNEKYR